MKAAVSKAFLHEVLRRDLASFIVRVVQTVSPGTPYVDNWHIHAIAWQLTRVAEGEVRRLLITLPPRHLKSICASVAFPAWLLGRNPAARIVCVSYAEELAAKHARECRAVIESPWYKQLFPETRISREKNRELDFVLTRGGGRYSTSVGGPLTGRGGDFVIIDDPLKPNDAMSEAKRGGVNEWYDRTVPSRLDDKMRGATIVVGQRLHIDDLVGRLLAKGEHWEHLRISAIAEDDERIAMGPGRFHPRRRGEVLHAARESMETLDGLRTAMGSFNFSAQYQQCPVPPDGELMKWKWFRTYGELPPRGPDDLVIQSWDTASKATELSDYSACTTWLVQGERNYLIDVTRERLLYPDLRRRIIDHARAFGANVVLIEDKGSGTSMLQDLYCADEMSGIDVIGVTPVDDKVTRMATQSIAIEAGKVLLPARAPWLEDFRTEVLQFPKGNYDDQVDSMSQLLRWRREADHVAVYF